MGEQIKRDSIQDRIGNLFWWLIVILAALVGNVAIMMPGGSLWLGFSIIVVGVALAGGFYYLITGRSDG